MLAGRAAWALWSSPSMSMPCVRCGSSTTTLNPLVRCSPFCPPPALLLPLPTPQLDGDWWTSMTSSISPGDGGLKPVCLRQPCCGLWPTSPCCFCDLAAGPSHRPIVEFALENAKALQKRSERAERLKRGPPAGGAVQQCSSLMQCLLTLASVERGNGCNCCLTVCSKAHSSPGGATAAQHPGDLFVTCCCWLQDGQRRPRGTQQGAAKLCRPSGSPGRLISRLLQLPSLRLAARTGPRLLQLTSPLLAAGADHYKLGPSLAQQGLRQSLQPSRCAPCTLSSICEASAAASLHLLCPMAYN